MIIESDHAYELSTLLKDKAGEQDGLRDFLGFQEDSGYV